MPTVSKAEKIADRIISDVFDFDARKHEQNDGIADALTKIVRWQYKQRLVRLLEEELAERTEAGTLP